MVLGTGFNMGGYCREIELASREGRSLAVSGGVEDHVAATVDDYRASSREETCANVAVGAALTGVSVASIAAAGAGVYAGYQMSGNPWVAIGTGVAGSVAVLALGLKGFEAYFN